MTGFDAEACVKGGMPTPHTSQHLQAFGQGRASGSLGCMHSPSGSPPSPVKPAAAAAPHHAVDPIEAPAPAWVLDPTHEAGTVQHLPAQSSSSQRQVTNAGHGPVGGSQGQSGGVPHGQGVQKFLPAGLGAAWSAGSGKPSSSAAPSLSQSGLQRDKSQPLSLRTQLSKEDLSVHPKKEAAGAAWHGFAASEEAGTTADFSTAGSGTGLVAGADNARPSLTNGTQPGLGLSVGSGAGSVVGQVSSQQPSTAAFTGFDVPDDEADESPPAESAAPAAAVDSQVASQCSMEGRSTAAAQLSLKADAQEDPGHVSIQKSAKMADGIGPSQAVPAKAEASVNQNTPAKPEKGSSAVFSRNPTGDAPSVVETGHGSGKVPGTGQAQRAGQPAQGRAMQAALPAGPVSGAHNALPL